MEHRKHTALNSRKFHEKKKTISTMSGFIGLQKMDTLITLLETLRVHYF